MYRAYLVPDATQYRNRAAMYQAKLLLWDPLSESDAYAVIGPKIKGELNKAESFEFSILPANVRYEQISKKISVIILYDDDEWIFEGAVSDCPKDFFKQMKVTCSGPLSYLCDSIQAPDEKNTVTIPTASENTYVLVPTQWYNHANPKSQGWHERSNTLDDSGNYTYTLTNDTTPDQNKKYYYVASGDNQNHSGSTITKKASTKETIREHLDKLLEVHNSQVEAFKNIYLDRCVNDNTQHEFKSSNYRETWSAIKSDIIEQYGRYITIKMDDNYTLKLNYLELKDMDSHTTPETSIVFADNMIEMSESDDSDDDIFTILVPTGKNNLTLSGLSGHDSPEYDDNRTVDPYVKTFGDNKRYMVVSNYAVGKYGNIIKTQSFSDAGNVDALWTAALKYIKNNFDAHTEYEVKGIDNFILGTNDVRIVVGRKCRVKSGWHGVDEKDLYVMSAEHDLVSPDNDNYRIGIPTSDREAANKTITGQTKSSSTNSSNNFANTSSQIASLIDILDKYASEHEGWIDLNYKFRNTVESENGLTQTRFEQDESHINMLAEKIFGQQGSDGVADQDAGWILIPKPPYRKNGNGVEDYYESSDKANTAYKVPNEHGWYVKNSEGKYVKSTQDTRVTQAQVDDPNVNFYIMRLATRYSDIDVGLGGIKARVDGNYDTSTYCSSWIHMNEDEILALTGHLYVDSDGHVHVTSGSGTRTNHEEVDSVEKYIQVARSSYTSSTNPSSKHWYERKLDTSNAWIGQGKSDVETNGEYYISTTDTVIDRNKYYYYKSYVRETFVSEFGVYDDDNLTAGVMAKVINHPTYHKVSMTELNNHKIAKDSPNSLGWYEYNSKTGTYGITLDTEIGDITNTKYYTVTNNMESWSYLNGDHIVIGKVSSEYVQVPPSEYSNANPHLNGWYEQRSNGTYFRSDDTQANTSKMYYRKQETYNGMSEGAQARISKYVEGHNLDGTITEIASDILYAHAIFTEYLNVLSTKLFGASNDDSDFIVIKAAGTSSNDNPMKKGWYEKGTDNKYFLSPDTEADTSKNYYITRLTSRVSDFVVGPDGIHGVVTGNYERSISSQAWIDANEEKLQMLLGHVGEDENGNLVIDSGAGFNTGYSVATETSPKFVLVERSKYSGANPHSSNWYELKLNSAGQWLGSGKSDGQTNESYYRITDDTSSDYTKRYYEKSTSAQTYVSEYGVYDKGNLTAGVIAQTVNNPTYKIIVKAYQKSGVNPSTASKVVINKDGTEEDSFWYVYDDEHGTYGRTTDTTVQANTKYYYSINSMSSYTNIRGDHIVIGKTGETKYVKISDDELYYGRNPKAEKWYEKNGNEYELTHDSNVTPGHVYYRKVEGYGDMSQDRKNKINQYIYDHDLDGTITEIASDVVSVNALFAYYIRTDYLESDMNELNTVYANYFLARNDLQAMGDVYINVGSKLYPSGRALGNAIETFGTPTYDGDNVSIPYYTVTNPYSNYGGSESSASGTLTFTKPASLGSVTWSSGGNTLTVKTAGGKNFIVGNFSNYIPSGSSEAAAMVNAGYLDTETTGYSTVYGFYYDIVNAQGNTETRKVMTFKTPKNRYPDAISTVRTRSATGKDDGEDISLGVGGVSTIYAQYKTEANYDNEVDQYTSLTGIKSYAPEIRIRATYNSTDYGNNSSFTLAFGGSVDVKTQSKAHDAEDYSDYRKLTVNAPAKPTISTPASATAPSGVTPTALSSYDTTYEVHLLSGSTNLGNTIYFKTPASNATSHSIDIPNDGFDVSDNEPSGKKLTNLRNAIKEAIRDKKWLYFKVKCGNSTPKQYYMDFRT